MTKIIIDGIDVSGCVLYTNGKCRNFSHLVQGEYIECNTMCDYGAYARKEQLQQLKKENEQLANTLKKVLYTIENGCYPEFDWLLEEKFND